MDIAKNTPQSIWKYVLPITLIGAFLFVESYVGVILLALLLAYIFLPMQLWLSKKLSTGVSIALTTVIALCIVVVPVTSVATLAFFQMKGLVSDVDTGSLVVDGFTIEQASGAVSDRINKLASDTVGVEEIVSSSDVSNLVAENAPKLLNGAIDLATGVAAGLPSLLTMFIIFIFLFTGAIRYHDKIVSTLKNLSPFDETLDDKYLTKIGAMTKAMLKGQLLIAVAQGFVGALSLLLLGLGDYFLLCVVLFSLLNLIPLGSGLITIPAGVIAIVTGNIVPGVIVLLTHFVVVTNIDNLLRPRLVPDEAYLPSALLILSAFAGVSMFGLLGVIYGPIIMITITTTIEAYLERNEPATVQVTEPKKTIAKKK
jgi:predicted PurR-regulated permease PerM